MVARIQQLLLGVIDTGLAPGTSNELKTVLSSSLHKLLMADNKDTKAHGRTLKPARCAGLLVSKTVLIS